MNLDWLAERERRVCSTDASTIVNGPDKFKHPDDVIRAKCRPILFPNEPPRQSTYSTKALWGLCLEEAVRDWYLRYFGILLCRAHEVAWDSPRALRHDIVVRTDTEIPIGASLDWLRYRYTRCDDSAIVECKSTRHPRYWAKGRIPERVRTQVIWQSLATGIEDIEISLMLKGEPPEPRRLHVTDEQREATYDTVARWYKSDLLPAMEAAREGLVSASRYQLSTGPLVELGI